MFIFTFTFALLFGILGVAFTAFSGTTPELEGLTQEELVRAGIFLTDVDSKNVSRDDVAVIFDMGGPDVEIIWRDQAWCSAQEGGGQHNVLRFRRANAYLGWNYPFYLNLERDNVWYESCILEEWVLEDWSDDYNWTHWIIGADKIFNIAGGDRLDVFLYPRFQNKTMTQAIADGQLTVTVGRGMEEEPNWWTFIGWYVGMSIPNNQFGMPWYFSIVLFLMNAMAVVSLYMMIRG